MRPRGERPTSLKSLRFVTHARPAWRNAAAHVSYFYRKCECVVQCWSGPPADNRSNILQYRWPKGKMRKIKKVYLAEYRNSITTKWLRENWSLIQICLDKLFCSNCMVFSVKIRFFLSKNSSWTRPTLQLCSVRSRLPRGIRQPPRHIAVYTLAHTY